MKWIRGIVALLLIALLPAVSPAWACACGGYLPDAGSRARAQGENALVRFDGRTEEIVLSMAIRGSSKKAAWIMPVPAASEVTLGQERTFDRLVSLTRPKVVERKTYWPFRDLGILGSGDGAGAPPKVYAGVDVRGQMVLGPFEVARLGGTSATAVTDWLRTNGYVVPAGLAENLTPYLSEKWEIVAVKLAPKEASGTMSGATPPLRLSFPSTKIVYPMRLSKGASTAQTVTVYVAAPYRVDASELPDPAVQPELLFAGKVGNSSLAELGGSTSFLTAYSVKYSEPSRITNDFLFAQAPSNDEYQRITYVTRNDGLWSTIGVLVGGLLLLGLGAALIARVKLRRARR
ncbi:uncharacterized protein DUF2330 [Kribbella amoyensis]|uniref:Uncharacterized protein DUF2330 n=1 Tax=Kribbella amoyensis TaxID=996641 RepID=A0A561C0Z4_9ACTN|nr:DUF2330 domain-containing protein [Kribbella amoyensis]TWD84846.1 uncharacterized protein DUF2330 [Kribbella amoyensis]